jgi:hypothetical protein
MKNTIYILLIALLVFTGCEDVYYAKLDPGGKLMVVEARLQAGTNYNTIKIYNTISFYDEEYFPPVSDAEVSLIDEMDQISNFTYGGEGMYICRAEINPIHQYKLQIKYDGEIYESAFEQSPELPDIDSIYGKAISKTIITKDNNGNKKIETVDGVQLYVDLNNTGIPKYYRFYARNVLQSVFPFDTVIYGIEETVSMYTWQSFYPNGSYNIAAPPKYSSETNIKKHPVEFFKFKTILIHPGERELGWIYIMHQYGITTSGYQFYEKLNKQLESEGKIFDPIYSQAFGNIKCISNKDKFVLGNFEIYNYRESRYFIKMVPQRKEFRLEKITTFYDIPISGSITIYPPDFWMN